MSTTVDPERVAQFLAGVSLFAGLDAENRLKVAKVTGYAEYAAGEEIFRQGTEADAIYILAQGHVGVFLDAGGEIGVGLEQQIATLSPGEAFGEMALLLDEPRTATIRAIVTSGCILLSREAFNRLMTHVPQIASAVCRALASRLNKQNKQMGFQFVRLSERRFDPEVYAALPAPLLERHQVVPLEVTGDALLVATTRPYDPAVIEAVSQCVPGLRLRVVACSDEDYRNFMARQVRPSLGSEAVGQTYAVPVYQFRANDLSFVEPEGKVRRASEVPGEQVVSLVTQVVVDAINRGASDIHIEPTDKFCRIRLRVDGRLLPYRDDLPSKFHPPVVSRFKILADMDIAERRKPQDGRIGVRLNDRAFDLRVNTLPTMYGEKVVMRVLDPVKSVRPIDELILSEPLAAAVRKAVFRPSGGIFIAGPTGSGKTTTLYSAVNERKQVANDLNIVSLEDPVEYTLDGVNQTQVDEGAGMGFASALRALLRQDPNVIMVGEMRDAETAEIALEAALTGHLVLSTLHADGAVESVARLLKMGCPAYLVATALDLLLAQRLLRRTCRHCAQPHDYSGVVRAHLARAGIVGADEAVTLYKGAGCDHCHKTGYKGRVGAYEVLRMNDPVREAISLGESESRVRAVAMETRAMMTFQQYAAFLVKGGHTTPSEALRMFGAD